MVIDNNNLVCTNCGQVNDDNYISPVPKRTKQISFTYTKEIYIKSKLIEMKLSENDIKLIMDEYNLHKNEYHALYKKFNDIIFVIMCKLDIES